MTDLRALCLNTFTGPARSRREELLGLLDGLIARLNQASIPCEVFVDGSLLTAKPEPGDIDVMVGVDSDVYDALDASQRRVLSEITEEPDPNMDSLAFVSYPRDHPNRRVNEEVGNPGEAYGLEHSEVWLKGYVQISIGETNVGNLISR